MSAKRLRGSSSTSRRSARDGSQMPGPVKAVPTEVNTAEVPKGDGSEPMSTRSDLTPLSESISDYGPFSSSDVRPEASSLADVRSESAEVGGSVSVHVVLRRQRRFWIALGACAICAGAFLWFRGRDFFAGALDSNSAVAGSAGGGSSADASDAAGSLRLKRRSIGRPVSESEAEALVGRFINAVHGRDFNTCRQLFNMDWVFEQFLDETDYSPAEKHKLFAGLQGQSAFYEQLHRMAGDGGEYVVLHALRRDGEMRVVVRLDGSVPNYYEFIVRRNERRKVEIFDVYILAQGDSLAAAMGRMATVLFADRRTLSPGRLADEKGEWLKSAKAVSRLASLSQSDPQRALDEYRALPADIQRQKTVMKFWLNASAALGAEQYALAFEEYRRAFPDDPSTHLRAIDYYLNSNDKESAIASIEWLDAYVGGDPALDQWIANIRLE